ncbi:OsmC family protein [bacterium]|nr:OsmC family protein [bacterium]
MKAVWQGGMRFRHTSASGHEVLTDAPTAAGGTGTAPSPMELMILGLIGCTGVDVASILAKMKQPLEGLEVSAAAERAEDHPRVYTRIHLTYRLRGDLDENKVKRAIELSESRYCSASAMLAGTATITHEFVLDK